MDDEQRASLFFWSMVVAITFPLPIIALFREAIMFLIVPTHQEGVALFLVWLYVTISLLVIVFTVTIKVD